jgi:hypothetical protein
MSLSARPDPTPEEAAAIVAALAVIDAERRAIAAESVTDSERLDEWQRASRLSVRGMGMPRGHWRLAGRIDRRARA